MGKKVGLVDVDRVKVTSVLGNGMSTLEIAKNMNRDHRTIKKYVYSGKTGRKTPKRSHLRTLSSRDIRKLKIEMAKTPHATSKAIFYAAGVPKMSEQTSEQTSQNLGQNGLSGI